MPSKEFSRNSMLILRQRYLLKSGKRLEEPEDLFRRVAKNIALAEAKYNYEKEMRKISSKYKKEFCDIIDTEDFRNLVKNDSEIQKTEEEFFNLISSLDFLPNSPTLFNAGRKTQQLSACFVLPIKDDVSSIFITLHDAALIHRTGAGTGFNFSELRPKGDIIEDMGMTSGPISFMKIFDAATAQIKLGGKLRGANMGILNVHHPDIMEFIKSKSENDLLENFNISAGITDDFMEALKKNKKYNLINPRSKKKSRDEKSYKIFEAICSQAWLNGDPGIVFIDRINKFNPTPSLGRMESTDSCGEQPLLPYESCCLGSINLSNMVSKAGVDYKKLRKTVHKAVHFLDNTIDMCRYPLKENRKAVEKTRKIGLGVMGFAEMLAKLMIPYGSERAVSFADEIMKFISGEADVASHNLALKRGEFPAWEGSIYNKESRKFMGKHILLRNATRTTIAPTGTISIIADTSAGIEPLFALSYARKTAEGNILLYFDRNLKKSLYERGVYSKRIFEKIKKEGTLKKIREIPKDIKEVFRISSEIEPRWHVMIQAAFQKHVDNGISKTVSLPKKAAVSDVKNIFLMAYKLGCKGVTVYREGSREEQVIRFRNTEK